MTGSFHLYVCEPLHRLDTLSLALVEGGVFLGRHPWRPPWCNVRWSLCLDIFSPVELSSARRAFLSSNSWIDLDLSLNLSGEPSWHCCFLTPSLERFHSVKLLVFLTILCIVESGTWNCLATFLYPFASNCASIILAQKSSLGSLVFSMTAAVLIPKWLMLTCYSSYRAENCSWTFKMIPATFRGYGLQTEMFFSVQCTLGLVPKQWTHCNTRILATCCILMLTHAFAYKEGVCICRLCEGK